MNESHGPPALVEIVTTVSTEEQARELAREAVEARLAACASFFRVRSLYRWKGAVCDEDEVQVVLKTDERTAEAAERWIRERHPYETPAVLRVPILAVNPDYERWALESLSEEGPEREGLS
jgi:periplasmic divalent cation tolerance protein